MSHIRIFLPSIGSLQGHAVTFNQVYVSRGEFMWDIQFVTILRIISLRLRVLFTPRCFCIHHCNKNDKRTFFSWREVPICVQEPKLRQGYRRLPHFYRARLHSTVLHSHITFNIDARESVTDIQPTARHVVLCPSSDIRSIFIYFKNHTKL
jgi:hypothetical protein